ncbi:MAG: GGDEF domain-containing protein [Oxalobacter sp.]|nr:MAG: GGDEF domain-containing protein [Oxalobacter sp.]
MNPLLKKYRLLVWIGAALVAGFLATSIVGYLVSIKSVRHSIGDGALPLTGDTIYSEIQKDILRPVFISSMMAHDTFVRDWIIGGEKNPKKIARYLNEVKQKYGVVTSFMVSEKTRRYYYVDGVLKTVREAAPRDAWFFRVRQMTPDYETNVDPDMANRDKMTIFINYRVKDFRDNFIAAIGVGLTLDTMVGLIDSYQQRFRRNIYFVDKQGDITLAGKAMDKMRGSIRSQPGIADVADSVLNHDARPTRLEYVLKGETTLVHSRFIPELGWYLIVEQNVEDDIRPIRQALMVNLLISAGITLLVLMIVLFAVKRFQNRLESMAATDPITGLLNRQAFDIVFNQSVLDASRSGAPMSAILFDIDHFKQVNDRHGHLAGDDVLREIAQLIRGTFRESDVICRWGGEEFLILLKACPLPKGMELAEKLRTNIAEHEFKWGADSLRITLSLGVTQLLVGESQDNFFARADQALYRAKNAGRNRTEALVPPTTGG